MSVQDTPLPQIPCTAVGPSVTVGGVTIEPIPPLGLPTFSTNMALSSVMTQLGPALGMIKAVGDLVSVVQIIIEFAESVPNAVEEGDPDILFDAIEAIKKVGEKLTPYIPATAFVATVYQTIAVIKAAVGAISVSLERISVLFDEASAALAEAQANGNASLESVANQLQVGAQAQLDCTGASLTATLAPLQIVVQLASAIPNAPTLPDIPDVAGKSLDELQEIVDNLYEALDVIA